MSELSSNPETIISNALGENGRYQIYITCLVFLSTFSFKWHHLFEAIIKPEVGNFQCSDRNLSRCDESCPSHTFDHTIWENTIIHEWDLVCEKQSLAIIIEYVIISGNFLGNLLFPYLADRLGRKWITVICAILHCLTGILAAFLPWLWVYVFLRWMSSFTISGVVLPAFSILIEVTHSKHRPLVGVLFTLPSYLAHALLGLVGNFCRRWDTIQLVVSAPPVLLLSYWCLLPESPRWLLVMSDIQNAIDNLQKAARVNKHPTRYIRLQVANYIMKNKGVDINKAGNLLYLFQSKRMRIKTAVLCYNWTVITFMYYGIIRYVGQIGTDLFWNIGIAGMMKVLGNLFACYLVGLLDRKYCLIVAYIVAFGPLFLMVTLDDQPQISIQIIGYLNIIGIAASYSLIYAYSVELFPTLVRTVGMGFCCNFARCGAVITTFLSSIKTTYPNVTPILFAGFLFLSAALTLIFLPETESNDLPDTVQDADLNWNLDISNQRDHFNKR